MTDSITDELDRRARWTDDPALAQAAERIRALEAEVAQLMAKIGRQQEALRGLTESNRQRRADIRHMKMQRKKAAKAGSPQLAQIAELEARVIGQRKEIAVLKDRLAATQADYEARILAAIQPDPGRLRQAKAEGMREAAALIDFPIFATPSVTFGDTPQPFPIMPETPGGLRHVADGIRQRILARADQIEKGAGHG